MIRFRNATRDDVPAVVALLSDDALGAASRRAQVESVRVATDLRGQGIGAAMFAAFTRASALRRRI